MSFKLISKIGMVTFLLSIFIFSKEGNSFEEQEVDASKIQGRIVSEGPSDVSLCSPTSALKRKRFSEETVEKENATFPSVKRVRGPIKRTLKGSDGVHDFIKDFKGVSQELSLVLEDIKNGDLIRLFLFLKEKQLGLKRLKFKEPVFEKNGFPFIDENGAIFLSKFFLSNKQLFSSFSSFEMRGQPIRYKGLSFLCNALSEIKSLKSFCVTYIEEDMFTGEPHPQLRSHLEKLLESCPLEKINLTNAFPPFILAEVASKFSIPPLTYLDLSANFIDGNCADILIQALDKKRLCLILRQNNIEPSEIEDLKKTSGSLTIDFEDQDILNADIE